MFCLGIMNIQSNGNIFILNSDGLIFTIRSFDYSFFTAYPSVRYSLSQEVFVLLFFCPLHIFSGYALEIPVKKTAPHTSLLKCLKT